MNLGEEGAELLVILFVLAVLTIFMINFLSQYLDKARLTVSYSAMHDVQNTLKTYQQKNRTYPTRFDFSTCSDQDGVVVFSCEDLKEDIATFVSYAGTVEKFTLQVRARDAQQTLITVTESTVSY